MSEAAQVIDGGLGDPVFDAQEAFRAVMDALANPGTVRPLGVRTAPPAPLTSELAALALTLCDHDSPVWLDARLAAVPEIQDWLSFHTGAPVTTNKSEAMFALVAEAMALPSLGEFALGSDEYPDRSTTLIVAIAGFDDASGLRLKGPGIKEIQIFAPHPLPPDFAAQWADNRTKFPRGIDIVFVAPGAVAGLPRSCRIVEA